MSEQTNPGIDEEITEAVADATGAPAVEGGNSEQAVDAGEGYEPENFNGLGKELPGGDRNSDTKLDVILDIPVTLSMEIGRTSLSIQDLLQLAKGSVVELDRMAGEPLDVLVNGTLVARGEVVVVNDKFGVRLSQVISPAERVRSLK